MIRAYDEIYLHQCRMALGRMLDFAVYDMKYDITYFYEYFIHSTVAHKIESGNTMVIAERSGVPLRTLQQYEQRQKNINRASAEYVIALARVLGCMPEELMEIQ